MKRTILLLASIVLSAGLLTGCAGWMEDDDEDYFTSETTQDSVETAAAGQDAQSAIDDRIG